jgi:error-prone DNA polymerase
MSSKSNFVHLHTHSEYSFLDGASHVEHLVRFAAELGMSALALTDHDNLCGAPEFDHACTTYGIKPIFGAEFTLDTGHITALAKNRNGYSSLCKLLTCAHLEHERNHPVLEEKRFLEEAQDLIVLSGCGSSPLQKLIFQRRFEQAKTWLLKYQERFGENFFVEIQRTFEPGQKHINYYLTGLAHGLNIPLVATNDVHYLKREQARTQDLLSCIKYLVPLEDPHPERKINGELFMKSAAEMADLFSDLSEACAMTTVIAERCERYAIGELRFQPRFCRNEGFEAAQRLHELTYAGAHGRYGQIVPALQQRIDYELRIIADLGFSDYFLVVHDLVQFAKQNRFRHAGRGSAADSVVAYCLDITKVDSFHRNLRFERFINPERRTNLPDIDIDFDSRYRDDVTQYVTEKYGKDYVATVCTFARFRARSAIRDVAKALGFSVEDIDRIAKTTHWATGAAGLRRAIERRPEMRALNISQKKYELLFDLCAEVDQLPRHISTHLGGVVITGDPIWEVSPLQMAAKGVHVIQYDKDGVEDLQLLKLDLLCLRMLGAVEDSVTMLAAQDANFDLDQIPLADRDTFDLIRTGNTAGAFQIESPAQMSLHPRLKTDTYEDIVASVALIRPGPVKGEMVEPFVRRRNAQEPVLGIHPIVDKILSHTYGVVLYQEQVVSIAVDLAGFTPGQADTLRRTISHRRSPEKMRELGETFVTQAVKNGIEHSLAEKVFSWLESYAGFGFCEAHAAAFGDTSYRTAYLLQHYPAEFYAAILNNQPMGFYPAATIINEARRRGIVVLNPDIQSSNYESHVESGAIRIGLKQIKGITENDWAEILRNRPYAAWYDFMNRCRLSRDLQERLVLCGVLDSLHNNRRALLYQLGNKLNLRSEEFAFDLGRTLQQVEDFTLYERLSYEWDILGFSPTQHPLEHWREELKQKGVLTNTEIKSILDIKRELRAAGWVIRPHTPPTKSGKTVVFFSLEDETGLLNVTVFPDIYEKFGHLIFANPLLIIKGNKDKRGANSLIASSIQILRPLKR